MTIGKHEKTIVTIALLGVHPPLGPGSRDSGQGSGGVAAGAVPEPGLERGEGGGRRHWPEAALKITGPLRKQGLRQIDLVPALE